MILLRMLNNCIIETPRKQLAPHASTIFALALYLIIERGKRIPRSAIAELFWPNSSSQASRSSLRRAVWKLREIGFPLIGSGDQSVMLPKNFATTDIDGLLVEPDFMLASTTFELLPWFSPRLSPQFSDWVDDVRFIFSNRITLHIESAITRAKARGDWQLAGQLAEKALGLNPESFAAKTTLQQATQMIHSKESSIRLSPRLLSHKATYISESPPQPYNTNGETSGISLSTPLVGRAPEMASLQHAFANAKLSCGSYIHLSGDTGIGKSRLTREFAAICNVDGAVVVVLTLSKDSPPNSLQLIDSICTALLNSPGAAGINPASGQRIEQFRKSEITATYQELTDSIIDLLDAVSDEQTVVLIIENIEFLSKPARKILIGLSRWASEHSTLIVTAATSKGISLAEDVPGSISVHLTKLPPADALTHAVNYTKFLGRPVKASVTNWAAAIGGGVPLHIEEAIKHWESTGSIDTIPDAINILSSQRLKSLSEQHLKILQFIAALTHNATHDRLKALLNYTYPELIQNIGSLEAQELVTLSIPPSGSTHILCCASKAIEDAAIKSISKSTEIILHAQIAELLALEAQNSTLPPLFRDIADHHHRSGNNNKAIQSVFQWIRAHIASGDLKGCELACNTAITISKNNVDRITILTNHINSLTLQGRIKECQSVLSMASTILDKDPGATGTSQIHLAIFESKFVQKSEWKNLSKLIIKNHESLSVESHLSEKERVISLAYIYRLAQRTLLEDSFDLVKTFIERNRLSRSSGDFETVNLHEMYQNAISHEIEASRNAANKIIQLCRDKPDSLSAAILINLTAEILHSFGFLDDAEVAFRDLFTCSQRLGITLLHHVAASSLTEIEIERGNLDSAARWNSFASTTRQRIPETNYYVERGRITELKLRIARGEINEAEECLKRIIKADESLTGQVDLLSSLQILALSIRLKLIQGCRNEEVESLLEELRYRCDILRPSRDLQYCHFTLYLARSYIGQKAKAFSELADFAQPFYLSAALPSKEITDVFINKKASNLREDSPKYQVSLASEPSPKSEPSPDFESPPESESLPERESSPESESSRAERSEPETADVLTSESSSGIS